MAARPADYTHIHKIFTADINERVNCGRYCAPLNGGSPLCCTTATAIPIVANAEWKALKKRTDIWQPFKPFDATSRKIVEELHESCSAVECAVAPVCQRDNRTLACRAFPFFPYFTKERDLVGIGYYWTFEDRCWILSNLGIVEPDFVREMMETYRFLFEKDKEEEDVFVEQSVSARRVFSRWNRPFPVLTEDGSLYVVEPKSGGRLVPMAASELPAFGPYSSQGAYREAVEAHGGDPDDPALPSLDEAASFHAAQAPARKRA
ncbi:MAG: hypothetical protein ACFB6R_11120 [Alphaproteobacteria bacterium]